MPFSSGTAETPTVLLDAINTHLVANSWTKLRGETDLSTDSPVTARYWRILFTDPVTGSSDFFRISRIELKTVASGANVATTAGNFSFSTGSLGTGSAADLIDGTTGNYIRTPDINDDSFWVKYDFGSGTVVREVLMASANSTAEAPEDFYIQWSNDDVTWTTMYEVVDESWTTNETKLYTFADTYRYPEHAGTDLPRRSGDGADITSGDQQCEDVWMWQGPGYDAARRVYIGARPSYDLAAATCWIELVAFTDYSTSVAGVGTSQEGANSTTVKHVLNTDTVDYWIYSNSLRIIIITKSGANNYHSSYIGFLDAFALPDEYPFPLFMSSTQGDFSQEGIVNSSISSMADPGNGAAFARLWDNTWLELDARSISSEANVYFGNPLGWTWPYFPGTNGGGAWPANSVGSTAGGGVHWMDQMIATDQDDLPLIPVVVMDEIYGNLGAMDGVFAVPSGGTLVPQQVITIDAQDYRVFPNIQRRNGAAFFAIRED